MLISPGTGLEDQSLGDTVLLVRDVPHDWLLDHVSLVVHHAGAGTTGAVLRAGLPSVTIPVALDQFFWADRLHRIGTAPPPIKRKQLSAERLAQAMNVALGNGAISTRAAAIGRRIATENGVSRAVHALHLELDKMSRRGGMRNFF